MDFNCTFHKQNLSGSRWKNYNKLRDAIRCQDIDSVQYLIDNGVQVNGLRGYGCESSPLHLAVISRCLEIVKILLDHGANVNDCDAVWETPIMLAARINDTIVLDLLLSYDVEHCQRLSDNLTHFHIACMRNRLDVIEKLLAKDNGDSINEAVNESTIFWPGFTPLHFAVYYGCIETVEYLLRCGANMMASDSKQLTPLHWADLQRNEKIIDLLLAAHKNEFNNPVGSNGFTHFHIACTRDNPSIVEHFLKLGVDIDLEVQAPRYNRYWDRSKPIQLSMYYECPKVTELLLRFKAYKQSTECSDLLAYAFITENYNLYNLFIVDRIDYSHNFKNTERISDFHLACINDNTKFMELCLSEKLINALSDLDLPIWSGHTPLHLAVKCNSLGATKLLLAKGASITVQDPDGKTPLHMAFDKKHLEIINIIVQHLSTDVENVTDQVGLSFLHIVCSTDKVDLIENFLTKGINANIQVGTSSPQWAGSTPMYFACKYKQRSVVELLLKYNAEIFLANRSIFDVFDLVFEDFFEQPFLSDFQKVLFDILMKIFSSSSLRVKYSNDYGISPLHALCLNPSGDLEMLKQYLITHKDEVNQTIEMPRSRAYHKCTPMHLAMRFHDFERAKLMIEAGANPLMEDGNGYTSVECAFLSEGPFNISDEEAQSLFPTGVPIESLKPSHFFIACCTYVFEFVNYVLSEVKDPKLKLDFLNCCDDLNRTPLHSLARQDSLTEDASEERVQMMQLLLKNGADVNAKDYLLQTPLHYVDEETVMLLIENGADVNSQNMYGETPLHIICKNFRMDEDSEVTTALLENGADINIKDNQDQTCLMILSSFNIDTHSFKEFAIPILKQFIKLNTLRVRMDEKIVHAYLKLLMRCDDVFDPMIFEFECEDQIESMALKNIDRYTTVRDILFKSSNEMTFYYGNSILQSFCEPRNKEFSFYKFFLLSQIERGKTRHPLLEESKKSLNFLIGKSLPRICLERILDYLTDFEVKNIILSGNKTQTI